MSSSNTLAATLRDEIAALFMPLVAAAQHPGGVTLLLRSLGHTDEFAERPELRAELERLATLAQQITDLPIDTLDSPNGIVQLLRLGGDLFDAVRGIEQLVREPSLAEQAQGLGLDLVEQLTALHLRTRHPTLLRIANLLTLVTPAETGEPQPMSMQGTKLVRLGWRGDRFHFDRIGPLLDRPLPTLAEHYFPNGLAEAADAHESARRLFPLLHLAAQALSLSNFQDVVAADPNAVPPAAPAEGNVNDHFGLEHDDEEPPPPDIPVAEAIDPTSYFEAHLPRFVTVLPGLVVDGVVAPARLALATKVSSARHPRAARGLVVHLFGQLKLEESRAGWRLSIESDGQVPGWLFGPDGVSLAPTEAAPVAASVRVLAERESAPGTPAFVFGAASGTRLEIGALQVAVEARVVNSRAALSASIDAKSAAMILASGDGFLSSLVPDGGLRTDFDLGLGWSSERGLTLRGSGGLDAVLPIGRSLGGLTLSSLRLRLQARNAEIAAEITANLVASIGPVSALVDGLGLEGLISFPREGGNLGVADLDFRFKPPTGVGLVIDASVVLGGGFLRFDPQKEEYSGVLELQIAEKISVKAIGLLSTRMPDGSKGYSLVAIIFAEGFTPIQLGLGFALTGIGGLLAIHRTFAEEALRSGLKNHTLDSVMFPHDPIRNAPQIISNLNKVFPPAAGHHLFGPMVQIAWGTPPLITAEVGVVLELGARLRLLILAQIAAILPRRDNDLVRLQMDAIGILDFDQGTAALDASLYDSRLLKKFVLTGDMAMRLKWEGSPHFALSVGGLHPAFQPPPNFPKLERIAINLSSGDNPRLRCESYFAITSNTVQFGARAELYAAAAGFSIHGDIGYDVLIQFDPFFFLAEFHAQLQLKRGSSNLFKVRLEGSLAGPRPLHLKGKATFEILWWDVSIRVDTTLVKGEKPPAPEPIDVLPRLREALGHPDNWVTQLPLGQRPVVTLSPRPESAEILLHPLGTLQVKENVVPLNMEISRFGQAAPAGDRHFTITTVSVGGDNQTIRPVRDFFAPAQFIEMTDDEKLSRPSFEPMDAGVTFVSDAIVFTTDTSDWLEAKSIEFETWILDKGTNVAESTDEENAQGVKLFYQLSPMLLGKQARFGAAGNSELRRTGKAKYRTTIAKYSIAKEGWTIVTTDDLTVQPVTGVEAGKPASYSQAAQELRKLKQDNPAQAGRLKILRPSELARK